MYDDERMLLPLRSGIRTTRHYDYMNIDAPSEA